ncbi:hypothetical protein DIPPA_14394 [Diplonema papillatum]|nr:hypothetical protein DIPPA_14394 [Diplonema papillatum]
MVHYTLVDDASAVEKAQQLLAGRDRIAVDCEFEPYGDNKLHLVQLAAEDKVVIVDIDRLGKEPAAAFLKPILSSDATEKLWWDCKLDCMLLKQQLGVDVVRVVDLQLAEWQKKPRQYRGYIKQLVEAHPTWFVIVPALRYTMGDYTDPELKPFLDAKQSINIADVDWSKRPLDQNVLQYSAADVAALHVLRRCIITEPSTPCDLLSASHRRSQLHKAPEPGFKVELPRTNLLEINVLHDFETVSYPRKHCGGCHQVLPEMCFDAGSHSCYSGVCRKLCVCCKERYHSKGRTKDDRSVRGGAPAGNGANPP